MITKTMVAAMILVMAKKNDSDDDERPIIKVEWDMKWKATQNNK